MRGILRTGLVVLSKPFGTETLHHHQLYASCILAPRVTIMIFTNPYKPVVTVTKFQQINKETST